MDSKDYDGFYFLPGETEDEINFSYFVLKEPELKGKPVQSTSIGDMYHIAFFKHDDEGNPVFDEEFEAIFADPTTYITHNIVGMDLYGCIFRKTENSYKWWNEYLARAKKHCIELQNESAIAKSSA